MKSQSNSDTQKRVDKILSDLRSYMECQKSNGKTVIKNSLKILDVKIVSANEVTAYLGDGVDNSFTYVRKIDSVDLRTACMDQFGYPLNNPAISIKKLTEGLITKNPVLDGFNDFIKYCKKKEIDLELGLAALYSLCMVHPSEYSYRNYTLNELYGDYNTFPHGDFFTPEEIGENIPAWDEVHDKEYCQRFVSSFNSDADED